MKTNTNFIEISNKTTFFPFVNYSKNEKLSKKFISLYLKKTFDVNLKTF